MTALAALKGVADTDGYEPDGVVVVDEFVKYLENHIPEQARALGNTTQEKESAPFIVGEETSHFVLTKNPKVTPRVMERLQALDALAMAGKVTPTVLDEGQRLLTRMPKLKARQELRKAYQQLADKAVTPETFADSRNALLESMKLPTDEAEKFTRTLLRAIDSVKSEYVKPLDLGAWAALAVKGVYRRLELEVPDGHSGGNRQARRAGPPGGDETLHGDAYSARQA